MAIINKKLIHFNNIAAFNNCLVAANADNNTWLNASTSEPEELNTSKNQIKYLSIVYIKDVQKIWTHGLIYNAKEYKEATVTEAGLLSAADKQIITNLVDNSKLSVLNMASTDDKPLYVDVDGMIELYTYGGEKELSTTSNSLITEKGLDYFLTNSEPTRSISTAIINNVAFTTTPHVHPSEIAGLQFQPFKPQIYIDEETNKAYCKLHYLVYAGPSYVDSNYPPNDEAPGGDLDINSLALISEGPLKEYLLSNYALATEEKQGLITAEEKTILNNLSTNYAQLDSTGKVLTSQLPSYVDDVLEYTSTTNFPTTGESGKIYVDTTSNLTYRWSGSQYTEISKSLGLGTTSSTAYRGDLGDALDTRMTKAEGKLNTLSSTINTAIKNNEDSKKLIISIPESWFSSPTSGIISITDFDAPASKYIIDNNYDLYIRKGSSTHMTKANVIYREGDVGDGNPKYGIFDCVLENNSVQHSILVEVQYTDSFVIKAEMEAKTILDRLNSLDGGTALYPVTNNLKSMVVTNEDDIRTLNSTVATHTTNIADIKADAPQPLKLYLSGTTVTIKESPDAAHLKSGNFDVFVTYASAGTYYDKAILNRSVDNSPGNFYRRYRVNYYNTIYEIKIQISNGSLYTPVVAKVGTNSESDPEYPLNSAVVNLPALTSWATGIDNAGNVTKLRYGEVKNILDSFLITINGGIAFKPQLVRSVYISTGSQYTFQFYSDGKPYLIVIDMDNTLDSFYLRYYK